MLKSFVQAPIRKISRTLSQLPRTVDNNLEKTSNVQDEISHLDFQDFNKGKSLLEPLAEDISHISTYLKPTYNFAAYANKSETIQELVKLGVNLHYIEKKVVNAMPFILRLKFDDIKGHILFFNNLGVDFQNIGQLITRNTFIFKEKLDDLEVRVNYLKFKKFTDEMITRIIAKNAFWLSYSTQEIDKSLGFFQTNFELQGEEVRQLAVSKPQLITFDKEKVKLNIFVIKEEMGFTSEEMKNIILRKPAIFMHGQHRLLKTFEYVHNTMKIPHSQILEVPEVLSCREKRLKERHQFLVKLKRDQFDPKKPNYINILTMIKDSDGNFATEVAKSSAEAYNMFLKTL